MSRAGQWEAARRVRIEAEVRASVEPGESEETILELVEDWIIDERREEEADRAEEIEIYGSPEDTACIQPEQFMSYHG